MRSPINTCLSPLEHGLHSTSVAMRLCARLGVDAETRRGWPCTGRTSPSGRA